jgi:hypothetical protein
VLQTTLTMLGPGVSRTSMLADVNLQASRSGIACLAGAEGAPVDAADVVGTSTLDLTNNSLADPNAARLAIPAALAGNADDKTGEPGTRPHAYQRRTA